MKTKQEQINEMEELLYKKFREVEQRAVKEFAEKLKRRLNLGLYEWQYAKVDSKTIDELLEEYEK